MEAYIREIGFDSLITNGMEKIDHQVTTIILNFEMNLVCPPTEYKSTNVAKIQGDKIMILEINYRNIKENNRLRKP